MDTVSRTVRSRNMSAIRSKGNHTTEQRLRASLVNSGIRGWKMNARHLPGTPDFVFHHARLIVFADGCYWHGCNQCSVKRKDASQYWKIKLKKNKRRDANQSQLLKESGWKVIRFWEHDLKRNLSGCMREVRTMLEKQSSVIGGYC